MKKLLLLSAFFCLQTVQANKDYELFLKGNQAIKSAKYQEALESYKEIKVQSAGVLYNTAYALYALGDYTGALVALREAELRASGDLFKKIRIAISAAHTKLELPQDSRWYVFVLNLQQVIWLGTMQISLVLILFLGLLMSVIFWRRKMHVGQLLAGKNKIYLGIYIVLLVFFAAKIGAYFYVHKRCGVLLSDAVSVFATPHTDAHVLATVPGGVRVKLVDENDAWCKMQYLDNKGWVQKKDVRILEVA